MGLVSFVVSLLLAVTALQASASDSIIGRASVIDGDTIEIRGQRIRLFGIDAPESSQQCRKNGGGAYPCGRIAAFALADRIGQRTIRCETRTKDRYGRTVAECFDGPTNLNAWMVRQGWAVAYRRYGGAKYDQEDRAAQADGLGVWQGAFEMPWDYRRNSRPRT